MKALRGREPVPVDDLGGQGQAVQLAIFTVTPQPRAPSRLAAPGLPTAPAQPRLASSSARRVSRPRPVDAPAPRPRPAPENAARAIHCSCAWGRTSPPTARPGRGAAASPVQSRCLGPLTVSQQRRPDPDARSRTASSSRRRHPDPDGPVRRPGQTTRITPLGSSPVPGAARGGQQRGARVTGTPIKAYQGAARTRTAPAGKQARSAARSPPPERPDGAPSLPRSRSGR